MRNSFKELEEFEMRDVSMQSDRVKNGITSDIGMLKYVSSIFEMYFPRIVDLFVGLAGGSPSDQSKTSGNRSGKYPDLN